MTDMDERHIRLRKAREAAGFDAAVDAARAYGWKSYQNNESGTAPFSYKKATEYAKRFRVRADWLYAGTGNMREMGVPIIGSAQAGPDGSLIVDGQGATFDNTVDPFDPEEMVAVKISGTSMVPRFRPNEVAIFGREHKDPSGVLNKEALVQTTDGRLMVKIIRRNDDPRLFDLHSINTAFDPLEGIMLDWARPFAGLRV